jgi:hypothetical protein
LQKIAQKAGSLEKIIGSDPATPGLIVSKRLHGDNYKTLIKEDLI